MNALESMKIKKEGGKIERELANGLTEIKEFWGNGQKIHHYFEDENGDYHGEYKSWYLDGTLWGYSNWKNGKRHGEVKWWRDDGTLEVHELWEDSEFIKDYLL